MWFNIKRMQPDGRIRFAHLDEADVSNDEMGGPMRQRVPSSGSLVRWITRLREEMEISQTDLTRQRGANGTSTGLVARGEASTCRRYASAVTE